MGEDVSAGLHVLRSLASHRGITQHHSLQAAGFEKTISELPLAALVLRVRESAVRLIKMGHARVLGHILLARSNSQRRTLVDR